MGMPSLRTKSWHPSEPSVCCSGVRLSTEQPAERQAQSMDMREAAMEKGQRTLLFLKVHNDKNEMSLTEKIKRGANSYKQAQKIL